MNDLPQMTDDAMARRWSRLLLHPERPAPTVIVVAGHPAALLLPYPLAATVAAAVGRPDVPSFTALQSQDLLVDLIYRAQKLQAPTAVTCRHTPAVAIVPLSWAEHLTPAPTVSTTSTGGN